MAKETDWGDAETSKEFGADDVERYRGRERFKDKIRIVSKPVKYYTHSIDRQFCNCSKTEGRCLLCENGYDRAVKAGCVIIHIADKNTDNPSSGFLKIGKCKVWLFGKDKWKSLTGILEDYDQIKDLRKHDLIISCTDEDFQKLEIRPTMQDSLATKDMMYNAKKAKSKLEFYSSPSDLDKQKEILKDVLGTADGREPLDELNGDFSESKDDPAESSENIESLIDEKAGEVKEKQSEVDDLLDSLNDEDT